MLFLRHYLSKVIKGAAQFKEYWAIRLEIEYIGLTLGIFVNNFSVIPYLLQVHQTFLIGDQKLSLI